MKLIKNWKFATALTAVLVLCALLLGVHRTVSQEAAKVEAMFTSGVDGSGYGIAGDLADQGDYASSLCKVAAKYDGTGSLVEAVNTALAAAKTADGTAEQYNASRLLTDAVGSLSLAMADLPLTEQDEKYRSEYTANFESRGLVIVREAAAYNEQVKQFEAEVLGSFPVSLLGGLAFLPEVEAFQ